VGVGGSRSERRLEREGGEERTRWKCVRHRANQRPGSANAAPWGGGGEHREACFAIEHAQARSRTISSRTILVLRSKTRKRVQTDASKSEGGEEESHILPDRRPGGGNGGPRGRGKGVEERRRAKSKISWRPAGGNRTGFWRRAKARARQWRGRGASIEPSRRWCMSVATPVTRSSQNVYMVYCHSKMNSFGRDQ